MELMLEDLTAAFGDLTTIDVPASVQHIADSQAGIGWDCIL